MRRYLCIYLPMWPVNLARRRLSSVLPKGQQYVSLLLAAQTANQIVVKRCCHECRALGVRKEMTLALAKALVPGACVSFFDPLRDFAMLQKLAVKLSMLSPLAAIDNKLCAAARAKELAQASPLYNGLILDLTGTDYVHLKAFGSHANLLRHVKQRLASAGIEARPALAPTIGAAWALSRFARESGSILDEKGDIAGALGALPVEALRLPETISAALRQIGIVHIKQLLALSRKSLGLRFGIELVRRIDQAMGAVSETLSVFEEKKNFVHSQEFEMPLTRHEELQHALLHGLQALLKQLAQMKEKPLTLRIQLTGFGITPQTAEKEIALLSGTNSLKQLLSIITPVIESIHFKEGVRALQIRALHTQRSKDKQVPFLKKLAHLDGEGEFSQLESEREDVMNNFVTRLGKDGVNQVAFNHSYIPERSFSFHSIHDTGKTEERTFPPELLKYQPPYLLNAPEPIQAIAMLPDKFPSWIKWRDEKLRVLSGHGPSRISDEWWHASIAGTQINERDYFRIQDQHGRWLWVFREQNSLAWYLHGIWI